MIGSLMMCAGAVILLVGMLAGIVMGVLQDFALAPAHAHLNLVGGVLLFLFGLYYRLIPEAGTSTLAKVQGALHIIGAILFPAGIAIVVLKGTSFIAAPIVGSLIVVAATALFAVIVFRTSRVNAVRLSPQGPASPLPSLFDLIHGIVRETDSPCRRRAQRMKKHEQAIEIPS